MITGYNTDVEFDGVVYHVQTEDKGLQTPVILSLVYSGGAILASKRSPYDDLVARGFDADALATRLQRQHKLICAAVHAGRIEDLKQLSQRESQASAPAAGSDSKADGENGEVNQPEEIEGESNPDRFSISDEGQDENGLSVLVSESRELRGGTSVDLRVKVRRHGPNGRERVANARVTVKTIGTSFPPQSTFATTDSQGAALIRLSLPDFTAGRAAILIRAESDGEVAELRRIILPSKV